MNNNKEFKLYYTEYNGKKLIKPCIQYKNIEFELLFGFKMDSEGFDLERIVDITDAI